MHSFRPDQIPLGAILLGVAIYLIVRSTKKLQTIGWMVGALVATLLLGAILGAILVGLGITVNGKGFGALMMYAGMVVADISGGWHISSIRRSIKRANTEKSTQPPPKP